MRHRRAVRFGRAERRELEERAYLLQREVERLEQERQDALHQVEVLEQGLDAAEESAVERLGAPSFFHRLEALKRERRHARESYGLRHPIIDHDPKYAGRRLAEQCGIAVPALLAGPIPIAELEEPASDAFVVKPNIASFARGVYPVVRTGEGLLSLLDDRYLTWDELVEGVHRAHLQRPRSDGTALIEQLVPGPTPTSLPLDWKMYCIGARVELIRARSTVGRHPRDFRYRYFDRDFQDLGAVRHADRIDPDLSARHPDDLRRAAETIAANLPGPFVRVDLFDGPDGAVFGEITPYPGGQVLHIPEIDQALGAAWERTEAGRLAQEFGSTSSTPPDTGSCDPQRTED